MINFTNEREIKKCIYMIKLGNKLGFDPTTHINEVAKSIKVKPAV